MLEDLLKQALEIKGVRGAAVVNDEGLVLQSVAKGSLDLGFIGESIVAGLASTRVLAGLLGEGEVSQTMIEYEQGPVLLTPLAKDAAGHTAVLVLDAAGTLGRVRFQLRRLLPEIARAVSAGA